MAWKNNRVPVHQILTGEFDLTVYLLQLGFTSCSSKIEPIFHSFQPLSITNGELVQHYQYVWAMLENWPDDYYKFLNQYLEHPMSKKGVGGLHKHFRDLYESIHRQSENKGIARIKVEFDHYIENYWPSVLESKRITRIQCTTLERNIVSKKEAAKILNCHPDRVDKLVQQQKFTYSVFEGKKNYSREQVEGLAIQISSNWTLDEACEALQLTRYQLKQLIDAGILHTLQRPDTFNRDWIVDKVQCQELISSLCHKARKSPPPSGTFSMISMQRRGYSIVRLVLAMQAGQIEFGYSRDVDYPLSCKQFTDFTLI